MIKEAYSRLKKEINASHILIKLPKSPSASDTIKALKKIQTAKPKAEKALNELIKWNGYLDKDSTSSLVVTCKT